MAWTLYFTLVVLYIYCRSENVTLSSQNGYVYVKEFYNLSITCQSKYSGNLTASRFLPANNGSNMIIVFARPSNNFCYVDSPYTSRCDYTSNSYTLVVSPDKYFNGQTWRCELVVDDGLIGSSNTASIFVIVPVTKVTLSPMGNNSVVYVVEGENQTFNCSSGPSRPGAWIQWYLGGQNVTNQVLPPTTKPNGDMFISFSSLLYRGNETDGNKSLYCEAVNTDEGPKVKSAEIYIGVSVLVKIVTIAHSGDSNEMDVAEGKNHTLRCTTGPSRPAAWIEWYIGGRNVTNQATLLQSELVGDKFISSSRLIYIGNDTDHNKSLHCEAANIQGKTSVKSIDIDIVIRVPVKTVIITPTGNYNVVDVVEGENQIFNCTTGPSRPAAWIQWYIGERNVTNQATLLEPQQHGDKFTASSSLIYTGNDTDNTKYLHCEAVNLAEGPNIPSMNVQIKVKVPVKTVIITPTGNYNVVDAVEGENQIFNCTTSPSRPAAWIQWYIGGRNVTNQATPMETQNDGDKFTASSSLIYTGNDTDHKKYLHCEAFNLPGRPNIPSMNVQIKVKVPVTTITFTPTGTSDVIGVVEGGKQTFTCTTGLSRPSAWIQWYIGERNITNQSTLKPPQQEDGDKFISSSSLEYTGDDADHNKIFHCEAVNIAGQKSINSTEKSIYIKVKPKNIELKPATKYYTIRETHHITDINCSALCRPECTYYWLGPNSYMRNNSSLILGSIYRNESGNYTCHGVNELGSISTDGVTIVVYYPPSITNLKTQGNTTVEENTISVFQCDIDSYPKSDIEWKFYGTGKVVHKDLDVLQSIFTINKTECSNTGIYECQASNIINSTQEKSHPRIRFSVKCGVREDKSQISSPSTIGLKNEDGLNITVHLIAVPPPVISWSFISNQTGNSSSLNSTNVFGDFTHLLILQKLNMSQEDFGMYSLTAFNDVGLIYKKSFTVIPQRRPSPPSNLSVSCGTISLKAIWKSEFDGGDIQNFRVILWDNLLNKTQFGVWIPDAGEGNYHEGAITHLQPDTLYFATIETRNTYGSVVSNEHVNCTTEPRANEESNSALLGAGIGSASGLIVLLIIVGVSFIIRRRNGKGKDENGRTHLTTLKREEEDDDGLKDNVLYQSAGPNFEQQKGASGNEYAAVQKKRSQINDNNVQETALYSELKAKSHKKPQGDVYSNVKITKTKVNGKKTKPSEDVYENMDIAENSSSIIVPKVNKNKDGLQYAELEFNPVPNGSKFVIRGIEDRTIYATVDTTQNIDPLPDSDDEDIGKNSNLEQRENEME